MKKITALLLSVFLVFSCSKENENNNLQKDDTKISTVEEFNSDIEYEYKYDNLNPECQMTSKIACTVDAAVKCIINPKLDFCESLNLPDFIFMEDENLGRPTQESIKLVKLKPLEGGMVEVHTDSFCDGNMFGLCNGRVIYVLKPAQDDNWKVYDIYAVE